MSILINSINKEFFKTKFDEQSMFSQNRIIKKNLKSKYPTENRVFTLSRLSENTAVKEYSNCRINVRKLTPIAIKLAT